jgi:twinkle protein
MAKTWQDFDIAVDPWETGERKKLCPRCSHTRRHNGREKCLSINIDLGIFHCHHCEWKGSLGYEETDWRDRVDQVKTYTKPVPVEDVALEPWGAQWLAERHISSETAATFGLYTTTHFFPQTGKEEKAIVFPYIKDGETVNNKYRGPKKIFATDKGAERCFYNFDALKTATDIFIVEGEGDVWAFAEAGITEVVSVPNGGTERAMDYLESATPYLHTMATITLAVDMDTVGRELEGELTRRIGREKCKRVVWPEGCKDAGEVLVKHGPDAIKIAAAEARFYPVGGSVHFSDLRDELYKSYHYKPTRGYLTGWPTLDKYYTVRLGEMTVVTGIPGSGKSEFLASLLVNLVRIHGFSFSIFSAENYDDTPAPLAEQLIRKWVGKPYKEGYAGRMTWEDVENATAIFDEHFAFINPEEPTLDSLLETAKVHLTRLGIKGLVLDPWNEISHDRKGLTETDYIGEALRRIRKFARMHDIHVWVVAHPTKMQRYTLEDGNTAFEVPTPYSVSGSANWYNKPDCCLTIYRFKHDLTLPVQCHIQKIRKQPDVGTEGMVEFSYDWRTSSYTDIPETTISKGDSVASAFAGDDFPATEAAD